MRNTWLPTARVVLSGVLAGQAAWSFRTAFTDGAGMTLLLAIAAPVAVATSWGLLAVRFRQEAHSWWGTSLAILGILATALLITGTGPDARLGPQRLLTSTLPTEGAGPELAAVSAVAGCTALLSVRSSTRDSARTMPLLAPLACFTLGLGLTASVAPPAVWYPHILVGTALAVVLASARPHSVGRLMTGVVMAVVAATTATLLAPVVAGSRPPASIQSLVPTPVTPKDDTNPMARFLGYHNERIALDITGTASEPLRRLPMVTLSQFDGVVWTPAADYYRAATQLPATEDPAGDRSVRLNVHVSTPHAIGWLPRLDHSKSVSVTDLGFNKETGDLLVPRGQPTPQDYTITGVQTPVDPKRLGRDDPIMTLPQQFDLDSETLRWLDQAIGGHSPGLGQFLGLYSALHDGGFRRDGSAEPRGGHGLVQIEQLVHKKLGTSEQYASALAVLGRVVGFETRVVLGFTPRWTGNSFEISGSDVHAWTEVRFAKQGWIPFDPTPTTTVDEHGNEKDVSPPASPADEIVPPDHAPVVEPPANPSAPSSASQGSESFSFWTLFGITGIVLLVTIGVVPPLNWVRRRLAYRTGDPSRRAAAAWRDAVASLRAGGACVEKWHTTGEVLAIVAGPSAALRELVTLANRVAFAPETPSAADADLAWSHADSLRGELTIRRRLLTLFDPRPLASTSARKRR